MTKAPEPFGSGAFFGLTGFIQEPDMVLTVIGTDLRHLVETMRLARANAEIDRRTK